MKVSEVIKQLEKFMLQVGDVELYKEETDGRSTWSEKLQPSIVFTRIWKGHPTPARWYFK